MGANTGLRRVLLATASLLAGSAAAAEQRVSIEVVNPRPFGHVIGDMLEQRITIAFADPLALDEDALPKAGRADIWLERRAPRLSASRGPGTTRQEIVLRYQVVNAPPEVRTIALPEVRLRLRTSESAVEEVVAEWPITLAPITPEYVLARSGLDTMRPDHPPPLIDTRGHAKRVAVSAALLALTLVYFAATRFAWPILSRPRRPFARAYRDLRRLARNGSDQHRERTALQRLHRAFDETAGRAVFKAHLERFFEEHPHFSSLRDEAETFYAVSRSQFFGIGGERPAMDRLTALARRCRDLERRAARGRA